MKTIAAIIGIVVIWLSIMGFAWLEHKSKDMITIDQCKIDWLTGNLEIEK